VEICGFEAFILLRQLRFCWNTSFSDNRGSDALLIRLASFPDVTSLTVRDDHKTITARVICHALTMVESGKFIAIASFNV
jgi:hypothetical protein